MGKKNIQPTTSSPVSRTLVVAPRPALEELRAEPQEGHISSLTGPEPNHEALLNGTEGRDDQWGYITKNNGGGGGYIVDLLANWYTSYDGDDE